ncbi:cysteine peptidase family C39 domain-containing protein [Mammaliicoccus sciuri]
MVNLIYKHTKQEKIYDCGIACVSTIYKFYKKRIGYQF